MEVERSSLARGVAGPAFMPITVPSGFRMVGGATEGGKDGLAFDLGAGQRASYVLKFTSGDAPSGPASLVFGKVFKTFFFSLCFF